jgi:hypothetical protein
MCNNSSDSKCIAEILKVINILQENAECADTCLDTCDRGFLGCNVTQLGCNTRPVMLYTCGSNGTTPWSMPTTKTAALATSSGVTYSSVFRVEKVDGNCATFRVLATNTEENAETVPYVATNSFFTMNLSCCCCLRCLPDTTVECI